tara:strand:+ start:13283 stop:13906 length:624 start_codon:yes stop_codon:yes gene_type:complete
MTRLISVTPDAEKTMLYVARVSSPNQDSTDTRLLDYCIRKAHWSVFEHAFMTIEIKTSRAISPQILRHRSFTFSEFSQRYAAVERDPELISARAQDNKNRQNSIELPPGSLSSWWELTQDRIWSEAYHSYQHALKQGIAKEVARNILPAMAPTRIYMSGSVRSWIHYIDLRTEKGTQKEHREIARDCKKIFVKQFPTTAKALKWKRG